MFCYQLYLCAHILPSGVMAVQVKDIVTVSPEAEDGMSPLQSFLWEESESLTVAENPVDAEEETQVREED